MSRVSSHSLQVGTDIARHTGSFFLTTMTSAGLGIDFSPAVQASVMPVLFFSKAIDQDGADLSANPASWATHKIAETPWRGALFMVRTTPQCLAKAVSFPVMRVWRTFWLLLVKCLAALLFLCQHGPLQAEAVQGVLDLSSASWQEPIPLEGEWLYYPGIFASETDLLSDRFQQKKGLPAKIPGGLRHLLNEQGQALGDETWGTLVLEIRNMKPPMEILGLHLRGDTAYQVFVVDMDRPGPMRSLVKVGKPSTEKSDAIPQIATPLGLWNATGSGHYQLIVHISGFYYTDTNLWTMPRLGSYESLRHELDLVLILDTFLAGAMFVMSVYYFSLFFHRREDKAALLLSALSSSVFLRHLGCSASIQQVIFTSSSPFIYSVFRSFEFGLLGIMGGTGAWFAVESFQLDRLRNLVRIQTIIGFAILAFCLLSSPDVYPKYILLFNIILFLQTATYLCATVWAIKKKARGGIYLTLGGIILALTVVHDMSIGLGYRSSPLFLTPLGMSFLIFANGQVVAKLFARAFRTAQRLSLALQEEVEQKTRRIRSMLDNIPQGVVNFIPPGLAEAEYSKHLETILETEDIAGHSIETLLLNDSSLSSDEKDRVLAAILASMDESVLNFELNSSQLLSEMEINRKGNLKYIQVSWTPIVNKDQVIESIQVTLNDVTELRRVEQESQEQKRELGYIQEILAINPENFRVFIDSSNQLLLENLRLIESNSIGLEEVLKILFINMHTIKGSARTLGLKKIATLVHDVEQGYAHILKAPQEGWNQPLLLEQMAALKVMLEHYQFVFHSVLGNRESKDNEVGLSREFMEQHCQLLSKLSQSIDQPDLHAKILGSLRILEEEVFQDAAEFIQEFFSSAERIARDLGKERPLMVVSAEDYMLSHEAKIALGKAIIHILRNALDHGIESTQERLEKGKAPSGCIRFQLYEQEDRLCMAIEDDGRGLNLLALETKGIQLGLAPHSSPQALAELVFHQGLSTANSVSEISGRGMGMEAIRKFIRDLGGDVLIHVPAEQTATDFVRFQILIYLPQNVYSRKKTELGHLAAR